MSSPQTRACPWPRTGPICSPPSRREVSLRAQPWPKTLGGAAPATEEAARQVRLGPLTRNFRTTTPDWRTRAICLRGRREAVSKGSSKSGAAAARWGPSWTKAILNASPMHTRKSGAPVCLRTQVWVEMVSIRARRPRRASSFCLPIRSRQMEVRSQLS